MKGVGGDDPASEVKEPEKAAQGGDLASSLRPADLTQRQTAAGGEGVDQSERRTAPRPLESRPQPLAVDGDHAVLPRRVRQALREPREAGGEGVGIDDAKQPREGVVARDAAFEGQELPQKRFFRPAEQRKIHATLGARQRRRKRNRQHFQKIVTLRVAATRNGNAINDS